LVELSLEPFLAVVLLLLLSCVLLLEFFVVRSEPEEDEVLLSLEVVAAVFPLFLLLPVESASEPCEPVEVVSVLVLLSVVLEVLAALALASVFAFLVQPAKARAIMIMSAESFAYFIACNSPMGVKI
jgi:hypothetical protein